MANHVETDYSASGFHPVHLNDVYNSIRYTVLHKLGHGGFATVWLARDSHRLRYVALKFLKARLSQHCPEVEILRRLRTWQGDVDGKEHVMSLLDHFWVKGPNGRHLCIVSEVGGPSIKTFNEGPGLAGTRRRLRGETARRVSLMATKGLAYIHCAGVLHGDFTPANILLRLANIDQWTVDELHERLGAPKIQPIHRSNDSDVNSSSPRYTVTAIDMGSVDPKWLSESIIIIDFGIGYIHDISQPITGFIGTPKNYCAPEFEFQANRSRMSDIWALGCTIFAIRTGSNLFQYDKPVSRDRILIQMVKVLGSLPESWWDLWPEGRNWYRLESMRGGKLANITDGTLHSSITEIGLYDTDLKAQAWDEDKDMGFRVDNLTKKDLPGTGSTSKDPKASNRRLIDLVKNLTTLEAEELVYIIKGPSVNSSEGKSSNHSKQLSCGTASTQNSGKSDASEPSEGIETSVAVNNSHKTETKGLLEISGTKIDAREASSLEDVLRKALAFLPDDRTTAAELAKNTWFAYEDLPNSP